MATSEVLRSRTARWLVPVAVVGVIAAGVGVSSAVANADPALPSRTAAELLVSLADAPSHPFSGTVAENADLGIPALPGGTSTSLSWQSLITGSHSARVWYASPSQVRLSLLGDMAESDVVRNGRDLWVWSSRDNTVSHTALPAGTTMKPDATPPIDPATAAARALAAIDPSTAVTVDGTSRVAGRPVYELVLAPRANASLIGQVRLGIDSETSVPLRVQVIARGASSPAFETAFTSITFDTPAASVFAFTPPPGAQVSESALPTGLAKPRGTASSSSRAMLQRPTVIGSGWTAVVEIPDATGLLTGSGSAQGAGSSTTSALLKATTTVTGSFGTGQLLQTSLVSVLLLSDGRAFVGAVTPDLLEQVAASAPR
jgi:outer membrane lipoprotein-sorting protein